MANPSASENGQPNHTTNGAENERRRISANPSSVGHQICNLMSSERAVSLSDVTLVTSDGIEIPAIRALLVIRSKYFETLLTCDFAEKNSSTVKLSLPAVLVRPILDFIYTDECPMIGEICSPQTKQQDRAKCDSALKIIELASAADYLELEKLLLLCTRALKVVMVENSHALCVIAQKIAEFNEVWAPDLMEFAFVQFMAKSNSLLSGCKECNVEFGVKTLSEKVLEWLFKKSAAAEKAKLLHRSVRRNFQILIVWGTMRNVLLPGWSSTDQKRSIITDMKKIEWDAKLFAAAKRLATLFDLNEVSPWFLSEVVEKSELVDDSELARAYKQAALYYELKYKSGKDYELEMNERRRKRPRALRHTWTISD